VSKATDEELLSRIAKMLDDGLQTKTTPVPKDNLEFEKIVAELQSIDKNDLEQKLIISGYTNHPVNDLRCLECMYFLPHRKWCKLPVINLPAEPEWWCRLWRI
jgi:hypothetical protein